MVLSAWIIWSMVMPKMSGAFPLFFIYLVDWTGYNGCIFLIDYLLNVLYFISAKFMIHRVIVRIQGLCVYKKNKAKKLLRKSYIIEQATRQAKLKDQIMTARTTDTKLFHKLVNAERKNYKDLFIS
jgi:hypothetical protein